VIFGNIVLTIEEVEKEFRPVLTIQWKSGNCTFPV